ncbi:MAG: hypothetical protein ACJ8CR_07030 [Roseiflexaceae bacterium]
MYQDTDLQAHLAKVHIKELRDAIARERMRARLTQHGPTVWHRVAARLEALRVALGTRLARCAQRVRRWGGAPSQRRPGRG